MIMRAVADDIPFNAQHSILRKEIEFSGRSSSARILTTEPFKLTSQPDINCAESTIRHKEIGGFGSSSTWCFLGVLAR